VGEIVNEVMVSGPAVLMVIITGVLSAVKPFRVALAIRPTVPVSDPA